MKRNYAILFLLAGLSVLCAAGRAAAQTNVGSTRVIVRVKFWDRIKKTYLTNPANRSEDWVKKPTQMQIFFQKDDRTDQRRPPVNVEDGSFLLDSVRAGEYRYFVETPDKSFAWLPPEALQDPRGNCPPTMAVECSNWKIHVVGGDHSKIQSILIVMLAPAAKRVQLKDAPEIRLGLYRVEKAAFTRPQGASAAAAAPSQATVKELRGKVEDLARRPLVGTLVEAYAPTPDLKDFELAAGTRTNAAGEYTLRFPYDPGRGDYMLAASKDGYEPQSTMLESKESTLSFTLRSVGAAARARPSSLPPRDDGEPLVLPPLEGARRYAFLPRLMQSLPVPGYRNFDEFALLAPGVLPPPQTLSNAGPGVGPGVGTAGQFAINGLRSRENNFAMDGSDNNDEDIGTRRQGFVALTPQPIETLQEFQVITALADANYGRNLGGQVNALTQSGGPDFHGGVYGFYTEDRLNARNPFDAKAAGGPPSFALTRAQDGAPVLLDGAPIVTANPSKGEDRLRRIQVGALANGSFQKTHTTYFGSLERKVNREERETHFAVPTVRQRGVFDTGDTGLRSGASLLYPSTVPGDSVFSLYPFPNNPIGPYGANTYTAVLPADADATLFTIKMSQRFGKENPDRHRRWWEALPIPRGGEVLTGRYNFTQDKSIIPAVGGAIYSAMRPRVRTQNYAFFLNRRFSARTSDAVRFSFGRTRLLLLPSTNLGLLPSSSLPGTPFLLNAPLLLNVTAPNANGSLNSPAYVSAGSPAGAALLGSLGYGAVTQSEQITGPLGQVWIPGFSPIGLDVLNFPQTRANNTIQIADTLRHVRQRHAATFGADIRKTHINSTLERNFRPLLQFNSLRNSAAAQALALSRPDGTPLPQSLLTGATLAAAGAPTGLFQTIGSVPDSTIGLRYTQVNFFAQDEWSVRPYLRLIYGLRYEVNTVPDTVGRRLERAFDPAEIQQLAKAAAAGCPPVNPNGCADLAPALASAFPADFRISFGADRNDFDGRFGFAFDLGRALRPDRGQPGRTVLRGGFGTYSGQFPGIVLSQSRNAFPDFLPLNFANLSPRVGNRSYLFNPGNPAVRAADPALGFIAPGSLNTFTGANTVSLLSGQLLGLGALSLSPTMLGLDLVLPQKKLKTGYSIQYGIISETRLFNDYYVSVSYVGTRGVKLLRLSTPSLGTNNAAVNLTGVTTLGASPVPFFTGRELPAQARVVSGAFAIAPTVYESSAMSNYNSMQLEVRRRYAGGLQLGSSLTYSHTIDDASDFIETAGAPALAQNSLFRSERASSSFDIRWRSASHFLYDVSWDLPGLRYKNLGGWRVAGIITAQTGQPFTVNTAFDVNRDGNLTDRLDTTAGLSAIAARDVGFALRLAPGVLTSDLLAPDGREGSVGRNTFRAPGVLNFDLSVIKHLNFSENRQFQLRADVFNLLNSTHFALPERVLESPAFGRSVRTTLPARTIQLALKFSF